MRCLWQLKPSLETGSDVQTADPILEPRYKSPLWNVTALGKRGLTFGPSGPSLAPEYLGLRR